MQGALPATTPEQLPAGPIHGLWQLLFSIYPLSTFSLRLVCCVSVPGVAVLFVVSQLSRRGESSPLILIQPAPLIFYGRDKLIADLVKLVLKSRKSEYKHIAIRGGAGMGKTSIALTVIHNKRIAKHFGNARHWVPCNQVRNIRQFLEAISTALNPDIPKSTDRLRDIILYLQQNAVPRIVIFDNFETIWGPVTGNTRAESEDILFALTPYLTILLTTRGPFPAVGRIPWHETDPIQPLPLSAAKQTFLRIRSKHIDDSLEDLLRAVDCIPQPVVLLASYGHREFSTSKLLEIWHERQTRFLDDGSDRRSNLDVSIRISLESPMMVARPDALLLLSVIAYLPDNILYDNLESVAADVVVAPLIWDIHKAAKTLIDIALVQHTVGILQVHSTIRSHIRHYHPLNPSVKPALRAFYFHLAKQAGHDHGTKNASESARQALFREQRNAETVILDALKYKPDEETILSSIDYSNFLIWNVPSLEVPMSMVESIRNSPSPGTVQLLPICWLRLGKIHFRLDEYTEAVDAMKKAEEGFQQLNQPEGVAETHYDLAEIRRIHGQHDMAADLYLQAYSEFKAVGTGSSRDMSACLRGLGVARFASFKYPLAVQAVTKAQDTCVAEDVTCRIACKRELGRIYRERNTTESIKLLIEARRYYLLHGPQVAAALCKYQLSIARYLQKDYSQAERGLLEVYEDFRRFKNYAQMGYCIYHRAILNGNRGSLFKALELYEQSKGMFEQMGNPNMIGLSLVGKAQVSAAFCRGNDAEKAYTQAFEHLERSNTNDTQFRIEMQNISGMCKPLWSRLILQINWHVLSIPLTLLCSVLFLRIWRCRRHHR